MAAPLPNRSFRFDHDTAQAPAASASIDLTASDGTGLKLISLAARVVVDDPLAFTELRLIFKNPEARQLEGRFRISLPPEAAVSRFAMRIGQRWQEGEVVEKQAARQAYEDFLHRNQDPALLEHEAGNEFSARIFPIEAHEEKEIILSYSHELRQPGEPYRLPLRGLPRLGVLDVRALVGGEAVELRSENFEPDVDFELKLPATGKAGLRHGNLVALRAQPALPVEPDEIGSLLILVDTSASRSLNQGQQARLVGGLLRGLSAGSAEIPVTVACFDQGVEVLFSGTAAGAAGEVEGKLRERPALGATDLAGALRWAGRQALRHERVLLVSDGITTAGDTEEAAQLDAARSLAGSGVKRLDALALGGLRDEAALRRLVTAGLERDGTVCDGDLLPREIAEKLTRATRSGIQVEVPGAAWVWPTRLDGVQPGEARLVYADLPADQPVRLLLGGQDAGHLEVSAAERPLLERSWVKARIGKLEALRAQAGADPDLRNALRRQILELSVQHRVVCSLTSLLVLETEADYARFKIDRKALADIITVGPAGLEIINRKVPSPPPAKIAPKPTPDPRDRPTVKEKAASKRMREDGNLPARDEGAVDGLADVVTLSASLDDQEERTMVAMPEAKAEAKRDEPEPFEADTDDFAEEAPTSPMEEEALFSMEREAEADRRSDAAPAPAAEAPLRRQESRSEASAEPPRPSPAPSMLRSPEPQPSAAPPAAPAPARSVMSSRSAPAAPMAAAPMAPPPPPPPPQTEERRREAAAPARIEPPAHIERPQPEVQAPPPPPPEDPRLDSWSGPFREVMELLFAGKIVEALARALAWYREAPGDVLALVALGEAAEATGQIALAARAYGSMIDLFPGRADLRRFAGERLARLPAGDALLLAIDTYRKAVESRPDHPSGHHLLGAALLKAGRLAEAFEAFAAGQARSYPSKFPGVDRILNEDLGLAAAAWLRAEPSRRDEIARRLQAARCSLEGAASVRFVLVWETDMNDVDFHIHDAQGGHAYYGSRSLPSGGELYADVTQGYGPECFTIRNSVPMRAYPYQLQAHYFRRGPMGYGMGTLQVIEHDGQGNFAFEERPYVIMKDGAYVDMGVVTGPLPTPR